MIEYEGFPLDVWGCGVVYITLQFKGIIWLKAAAGDKAFERYLQALRASEVKAASRAAKLAQGESKGESKGDTNDADEKASISDDAMSRVSSALSFKIISPLDSPPHGYATPGSPSSLETVPPEQKSPPSIPRSFKTSPSTRPIASVQIPPPIGKASGDFRTTPQYGPFESFHPLQKRLIFRILDPNPETRITAAEILKDPWFKEIQCCSFDTDELSRVQSGVFDASKPGKKKIAMPVKHKHSNHLINGKAKK